MSFKNVFFLAISLIIVCINTRATAQSSSSTASNELQEEILRMDSVLFTAFNHQDLETIMGIFSKDLEFYHDKAGLSNYEQNMKSSGDLFNRDYVLHRELVPGTTEIHPIKDYGAIQIGQHEFCHEENGKMDCGTFKFIHIWQRQEDGSWQLTRVISYDH